MMNTVTIIKGTMLAASLAFMMMAAHMANASETTLIPTLRYPLKKGIIVNESMLVDLEVLSNKIKRSTIDDGEDLIGLESTRNIRAGYPLSMRQFRVAPTVKRGNMATLQYKKAGITLTTEGTVMNDAVTGEWVKVMNHKSKRLIQGIVQANGTITVN